MNDPQGSEAQLARFFQVFFDDGLEIAGGNTVQVEYIRDRNPDGLFLLFHCC